MAEEVGGLRVPHIVIVRVLLEETTALIVVRGHKIVSVQIVGLIERSQDRERADRRTDYDSQRSGGGYAGGGHDSRGGGGNNGRDSGGYRRDGGGRQGGGGGNGRGDGGSGKGRDRNDDRRSQR
eukprot:CAMPEP_0179485022 /NCGR_PEP_ID=MMETSP0799-20121207/61784_1 /TAXON_ID=46947 /ORGANISM="Geminigera cryophila, Strain CCMP2564" /LENGTH=123 /DNA_ID=CAMNT_0021299281 /DNA_START=24 /DNA_END=396 /DNA_ORIENTATION=-